MTAATRWAARWAVSCLCACAFSLAPVTEGHSSIKASSPEVPSTAASLLSIASWLERSGERGWMGADVADVLQITRPRTGISVAALQKAFRTGETLHLAQVPADERHEFLLFMVKGADEEVYFYLSTVAEGLKRAFVAGENGVLPLEAAAAERGFREEVTYWQDIMAMR